MALKNEGGRVIPVPDIDMDGHFYEGSIRTVRDVVDAVAENPDRRKIVIYVTTGVPIDSTQLSPQLASGTGKGMPNQELHRRLTSEVVDLFRHAQLANVTLYTVDPMGLDGFNQYLVMHGLPRSVAGDAATHTMDYLVEAAANTGGRAIVNTNDFGPGLVSIFAENHAYYLLAYAATDPGSGKYHRLAVKVSRPGVEVHTRVGYYASDPAAKAKEAASRIAAPLTSAIAGVMPATGLSLEAVNTPFVDPATGSPIVVGALRLHIQAPSEAKTETVDVQASPFTPDGYPTGPPVRQSLHLSLRPGGPSDTIDYEWLVPLPLKPGRYQVRFAARVEETDTVGSVFADVDVPKFLSTPVSLSGVVIATDPAPSAAPKDTFAKIIPVVPNTARTFAKSDRASAFAQIYQGGAASLNCRSTSA